MKEIVIRENEAGQRLDKYLKKLLPAAGTGFLYKMLRKKNIDLNGSKSDGHDILDPGDKIHIFFSDETYEKMRGLTQDPSKGEAYGTAVKSGRITQKRTAKSNNNDLLFPHILAETKDVVFLNKPAGLLSQGDGSGSVSVNDWLREHYGEINGTYKPSVCNRLDRNTSGIIIAALSYAGSRFIGNLIIDHNVRKKYLAIAEGALPESAVLKGYLHKDRSSNIVKICDKGNESEKVVTEFKTLVSGDYFSVAEVDLITGKSHQIRAHFASIGHPLAGDIKYGGHPYKKIRHQMLHSWKLELPEKLPEGASDTDKRILEDIVNISGRTIICPIPEYYPEF